VISQVPTYAAADSAVSVFLLFSMTLGVIAFQTEIKMHEICYTNFNAIGKREVQIWAIINIYSHYNYPKRGIEFLIRESYFFAWEELPARDPDTGYVTKAGYIPIIQSPTKYVTPILFAFHDVQSTVRVVMSHDMVFTTWAAESRIAGSRGWGGIVITQVLIDTTYLHSCVYTNCSYNKYNYKRKRIEIHK
jgi:hypothetical protein